MSHSESHKLSEEVPCDLCKRVYKSMKYMEKHRRTHFLNADRVSFSCDICHKQFTKKSLMKTHILIHSAAEHSCPECLRMFKKMSYLKAHMGKSEFAVIESTQLFSSSRRLATHTGEKKFQCPFCDRSFADSGNCRKHKLRYHSEEITAHETQHGKKGIANVIYANS